MIVTEATALQMANDRHILAQNRRHPIGGRRRQRLPSMPKLQSLPAEPEETDSVDETAKSRGQDLLRQ